MRSMFLYATLVTMALFFGACAGRQTRVHVVPTVPVVTTSPPIDDAPVPPVKPTTIEVAPPIVTTEITSEPVVDAVTSVAAIESPVPTIAWAKTPSVSVKDAKAAKRHVPGPTRVRPPVDSRASAPAPARADAKAKKIAQLERENAQLKAKQAELLDQLASLKKTDKTDNAATAATTQNAPQASKDAAHAASDTAKPRPPPKRTRSRAETLFPRSTRKSASGEGHLTWFHAAVVFGVALTLIAIFSFSKRSLKVPLPDEDDAPQDDVSSGTHVISPPGVPPLDWLDQMDDDQLLMLTDSMRKRPSSATVHSADDPQNPVNAPSASADPPTPDASGPTGSSDPPDKPKTDNDPAGTIFVHPDYYS